MSKKPRENRVPIMMSAEELEDIDDWRYQNRVATRSDAVRRLVKIGLACDGPISITGDGASKIFEAVREHHKTLAHLCNIASQMAVFDESLANRMASPLSSAVDRAAEIVEELEYLQLILQSASNQVAELADHATRIDVALELADDWKEQATQHLNRVKRRQAARAKRRTGD